MSHRDRNPGTSTPAAPEGPHPEHPDHPGHLDRLEPDRADNVRLDPARPEPDRADSERLDPEPPDPERAYAGRLDPDRLDTDRPDADRPDAERLDRDRVGPDGRDADRLDPDVERLDRDRGGPDRRDAERLDPDDERWVAYVRADHRTGTIAALAGVFATRGVNFESLATGDVHDDAGLVVVTFCAGLRRQRVLTRAVGRLPMVRGILVRAATDPRVRAAAVLSLPSGSSFRPAPGAGVRWFGDPQRGEPMLVEGPLVAVEAVVSAGRADGGTSEALVLRTPTG